MSAASVRISGRRDNLPVFPKAAGNKGEPDQGGYVGVRPPGDLPLGRIRHFRVIQT
jgi:hypothetical protein